MSNIDDAAAKNFADEQDRTERSPAQPDDATRIDDDAANAPLPSAEPPHVKTDRAGRMQH